ncbi:MAG: branched-chain-amino-acid transaminase [Phycisphaerales bacterium]|nr:branched-chain-amino-acid transaminase [Phycisphaerales bacterium]
MRLSDRVNPFTPNPELRIWIDGDLRPSAEACINVFDHGLLYGDGVFEGIRVYGGEIFKEGEHIDRIFESAGAILLEMPLTRDELSAAMHETIEANGVEDGYIRLLVTRGVGALGISIDKASCPSVIIIAATIQLYPPELYDRGLRCMTPGTLRNHPSTTCARVKSLNYLNNVMAKAEAKLAGYDEGIMLNADGYVTEGTGDNVFIVKNGGLFTPPLSCGILAGITRKLVMELALVRGYVSHESLLLRHDVYTADECFLTGTAAEIIPVASLDKRPIGEGRPGPITRQLMADFADYRTRRRD